MEAIGAGASVIAFIGLGLKSAKIIYEILSDESGTHVGQVRMGIQDLQSTLERLGRCRAVSELQDQAFQAKIQSCADNLATFAASLQNLTVTDGGPRFSNQLKKLRAFLGEKELSRMNNIIIRDTGTLKLYLQALESDTVFQIRDSLAATRQELSTFQTIKDNQSTLIAQHVTLSTTVRDSVKTVNDDLRLGFQESAIRSGEVMQKLVHLSDQSTAHSGDVTRGIDQLADLVSGLKRLLEERSSHSSVGEARDNVQLDEGGEALENTPAREVPPYNKLLESVRSVLGSVRDKTGIFSSNDAEGIADSLVKLLQEIMSDKVLLSATTYQYWCDTHTQEDLEEMRRTLRCLQGILLSSSRIAVNPRPGKRKISPGALVRESVKRRLYPTNHGDVSVISFERRLGKSPKRSTQEMQLSTNSGKQEGEPEDITEVQRVISFLPASRFPSKAFQLATRERHDYRGTYYDMTRISVVNVLPIDSPVFALVEQGRLVEFKEMLMRGEASLRDQDEFGTPLLFYANTQPDMCRFLLQHGADVDHIGHVRFASPGDDEYTGTALVMDVNDDEEPASDLSRVLECRKLLLEAGCDPELPRYRNGLADGSPALLALEFGVLEAIRLLLDNPLSLINTETIIDDNGSTMLLTYCDSPRLQEADGLSFLLSRGADINARDLQGNTCLHLCLSAVYRNIEYVLAKAVKHFQTSLVFLVENGANIHAVNRYRVSVSQLAYHLSEKTSFLGDLWDAVLAEWGHDVLWYRRHWTRKPQYRRGYTRQMFEELWKKREHLCPYYNDESPAEIDNDERSTDSDGEESGHGSGEESHVGNDQDLFQGDGDTSDSDSNDEGGCPLGPTW